MKDSWKTLKLPLSPTFRKNLPQNLFSSTARSSSRNRISTPVPRPPSTPTGVRPSSAHSPRFSSTITGISQENLRKIYLAKCADLLIPENPNQEERFYKFCEKNIFWRKFVLKDQGLGPLCGKSIGEILQRNQDFCRVDLANNRLTDVGIIKLAKCLVKNSNILHVDVSSNELGPEGLKVLIESFVSSANLVSLDLSSYNGLGRNRLSPLCGEALCNLISLSPVLIFLELNETCLNDAGLEWVVIGLEHNSVLLKLGLANNNLTAKHLTELCKNISVSALQDLNLSGNKIGDDGCKPIAELLVGNEVPCKITKLDISKNEITYKGSNCVFLALRYNSGLTHLNISENVLGPLAGQSLHFLLLNNFKMAWFNLNSCGLKNGGISHLALGLGKNKALISLFLANNACKDLGMSSLCEALSENEILANLDLSNNFIRDGEIVALTLKENAGLESVNFKDNRITAEAGSVFVEATKVKSNLMRLNLDANQITVKHLQEIKANLKRNEEIYKKHKAPNIKKEIEKLQSGKKNLQEIFDEINKKKRQKIAIIEKTQKLKAKVEEIKKTPDSQLAELKLEYEKCRDYSLALSTELDKLLLEILKFRVFEDISTRELRDTTAYVVAETKNLEKKSKFYLEPQKREDFALKRSTLTLVISQLEESAKNEEFQRNAALEVLNELNQRMFAVKSELDQLKYSDSFYEERKVISPQPFIRPMRRGDLLHGVRKERAKTVARKLFLFSPRT